MAINSLFAPYAGIIADSVEPYISLPIIAFWRLVMALLFIFFVNTPDTDWFIYAICLIQAASTFEDTVIKAVFNKGIPSDVRGVMSSAFETFGSLFKVLITLIFVTIYDASIPNNKSVFWGLVVSDWFLLCGSLGLGYLGHLALPGPKVKEKAPREIVDSEDEYEDDGFMDATAISNKAKGGSAKNKVKPATDIAGTLIQEARKVTLNMLGDTVTAGGKNPLANNKGGAKEASTLPISDHNVFNCEEHILETAE